MRRRVAAYTIIALAALLLGILPVAVVFDLATPLSKWETWYWPGQPAPRPKFNFEDHWPPVLRAEAVLYKILVIPPAFVRAKLTGFPGNYGLTFISPGSSSEAPASLPPAALALEHLQFAVPFWFVLLAIIFQVGVLARRKKGSGAPVA